MGVISISESLLQHQRQLIKKAFPGAAVMAHYGMSEKVAYAGELPRLPDHYEFEPLYGHTELLDDEGRSVTTPGHIGRIVATGFLSEGMPFVRYDTGDMAELVRLPSPENCFRLRVRGIRSRWGQEFLVARSGALMSIASINVHSPIYARIREFQFFQDTPGEATVRVVPLDGYAERDIRPFVEEIQRKVGAGVSFRLELCDAIAANTRGKRPFIEQKLSIGLGAC
jgi:phenylacetate-CoA ligase